VESPKMNPGKRLSSGVKAKDKWFRVNGPQPMHIIDERTSSLAPRKKNKTNACVLYGQLAKRQPIAESDVRRSFPPRNFPVIEGAFLTEGAWNARPPTKSLARP